MEPTASSAKQPRTIRGMERAHEGMAKPQKRFFRQRAHINPLSISGSYLYPVSPDRMDWSKFYPAEALAGDGEEAGSSRCVTFMVPALSLTSFTCCVCIACSSVEVADIGCGFGGLIMGLAPLPSLRHRLVLGMEIRPRVTEYVRLRILAARREARAAGGDAYSNASVMVTNAMKLLTFYFNRHQLTHMFFCFPDPHFKKTNHRRRIVTTGLLAEYAFVLRPGGRLYTITDVADLHAWMAAHCEAHPAFRRVTAAELEGDPVVPIMATYTEEGQKVARNAGQKHVAVFQRLSREEATAREAAASGGDFWREAEVKYVHQPAAKQTANAAARAGKRPAPEAVLED